MPATYEPIATTTVSGSTTDNVEFTSIPATYTDLVIVIAGSSTANVGAWITFNGSSTGYSNTGLGGDGSSAYSWRRTSQAQIKDFDLRSGQSVGIINIQNYANTNTYKTLIGRNNAQSATQNEVSAVVGLWQNTAAIHTVKFTVSAGGYYFNAGSVFTIYGIKAA